MNKRCIFIGIGGHSKVVADVARKAGYELIGCLDDRAPVREPDRKLVTQQALKMPPYLGTLTEFQRYTNEDVEFFIAIGNNTIRQQMAERLAAHHVRFATLIDPTAIISESVVIEPGTVVMPGVIVNADAHIGQHVILNTGATIDHDCQIGDFAHVSPGAHLAGAVRVGNLAHVGIGANIIQQLLIGTGAIIGAGAAVIRDIPPFTIAVGVPAKIIKSQLPQQE